MGNEKQGEKKSRRKQTEQKENEEVVNISLVNQRLCYVLSECAVALGSWVSLWPAQSSLTVPAYFRRPQLHNKYSTGTKVVILPQTKGKWLQNGKRQVKVKVFGSKVQFNVQQWCFGIFVARDVTQVNLDTVEYDVIHY